MSCEAPGAEEASATVVDLVGKAVDDAAQVFQAPVCSARRACGSRIPGGIDNVYGPARRIYDPADSVRRRFNALSPMAMRFVAMWSAIGHQGPAQGASGGLDPYRRCPDLQGLATRS